MNMVSYDTNQAREEKCFVVDKLEVGEKKESQSTKPPQMKGKKREKKKVEKLPELDNEKRKLKLFGPVRRTMEEPVCFLKSELDDDGK